MCRQSGNFLSWSHYRALLQVEDKAARDWYEKEASEQTWSVRTLQRNISSQYYYRMLKTQKKELVEDEMKKLTASYQNDKLEFIKNPVVAEFLGFSQNADFTESDLEKSILSNLQKFLMELGKGYAFVARQQHIHTEKQDYYIDLVFYNYILKCFVLIDLKTEKITHQDVGQMDMYIRMYDELKRSEGDNPTIGIVLCSDTDDDIARYSVMHGNEQLFASKYKLYLPTEEELKAEIETQKAMFYLQQKESEEQELEYCKWCYADGTYTYNDMDDLIEVCVKNMVSENFTEEQARSYMKELLPTLDYWKKYDELSDNGQFEEFKEKLINEINELNVDGMPKVEKLNALVGKYVNLEYRLPNGQAAKFLNDAKTYLGNQFECEYGGDRCFGVVADMDFILICTYEEDGKNPELVLYKKR